jgi:hypothetical protein
VTTAIQVDDSNHTVEATSPDQKDGYSEVSSTWAEQDPDISFALNGVIKANWDSIQGHPLEACWAKPENGVWNYRFYFQNVTGKYEWSHNETSHTNSADAKPSK